MVEGKYAFVWIKRNNGMHVALKHFAMVVA
jgi:hypothetical protein